MFSTGTKLKFLRDSMEDEGIDTYIVPSEDDHFSEYISPSDARRSYLSHFTGSAGVALVTLPSPSISTSSSSSNSNPAFQSGRAILWTDSRYYLQAAQELDLKRDGGEGSWELMKLGMEGVKKLDDWLVEDYATTTSSSSSSGGIGEGEGKLRIGIDPKLIPYFRAKEISDLFAGKAADGTIKAKPKLKGRRELELVPVTGDGGGGGGSGNLVDRIWEKDGEGRVGRKVGRVFVLPEKYAGQPFTEKIERLRETLKKAEARGMVVTMLDEVAWLFNLRGDDIPFNPVFFAYALITPSTATLYIRPESIDQEVRKHLEGGRVAVKGYEEVWGDLRELKESFGDDAAGKEEAKSDGTGTAASRRANNTTLTPTNPSTPPPPPAPPQLRKIDPCNNKFLLGKTTSWAIALALGEENVVLRGSPVADAKALKNEVEVGGMERCHVRDGAALARYFAWLEEALKNGEEWNEHDAALKLEGYRSELDLFKGLSFTTISSTGPNAAIVHYHPSETTSSKIEREEIYLCDSGGQYWDGTTDVTRTWHFGTPTDREIRAFTRVLQGMIAIDSAVFPKGTTGFQLDVLARAALWKEGLDFMHSTSHGVGSFLNVHEGPASIGPSIRSNEVPLLPGLVLSNEPGYYEDGKFGIRIENMMTVVKAETPNRFNNQDFYKMKNLTFVPIQTTLIDHSLLSPSERSWLNEYHKETLGKVRPVLEGFGDERAVRWLERMCEGI